MAEAETLEAVNKVLETSRNRKFLESIELAFNLKDVDLSNPKNRINEEVLLPKGRGRPLKIGVFGSGDFAAKAKASADTVVTPEELETLAGDKAAARKFVNGHDWFVSEAPLMVTIGKKLGTALGPKGKMPRPLPPQADPGPILQNLRNTVRIRSKDRRTFHVAVGSRDMSPEDLAANIEAVLKRVTSKLERGSNNLASVYVKTSMGPSVRLR
jgi:large subunit ribosomal protein L1